MVAAAPPPPSIDSIAAELSVGLRTCIAVDKTLTLHEHINPKHLTRSGDLVHFSVDQLIVSVRSASEARKVLHLRFGRDGSIYAQFPYFTKTHGVAKELIFPDGRALPSEVNFGLEASLTSHLVKFAHHPDGEVHFSQDGKVLTKIRRRSFPLDGPIGHIFQMSAYDLDGFEALSDHDLKLKRPSIEFYFDSLPAAVSIMADWTRKAMYQEVIARSGGGAAGPILTLVNSGGEQRSDTVVLAPPSRGRRSEHVLSLTCTAEARPLGVEAPMIIFIGGWDPHEVKDATYKPIHTGALFCMYPVDSDKLLAAGLDSIDLKPIVR